MEERPMPTEVKNSGVAIVLSFFWTGLGRCTLVESLEVF
jgi:hypothetical protein